MAYTPREDSIIASREFLRALSAAEQIFALYPDGHPNRLRSIGEVFATIRKLQQLAGKEVPILFVARHSFYLGDQLLARESLSLFRLIETLEKVGVRAIEFTGEATGEDTAELMGFMHGEKPFRERFGGLVLNRVRPTLSGDADRELRLTEMRQAYAAGLGTLREQSVRIAAGKPVDIDAATRVVERIADQVMADPSHAMLLTTIKSYDEYTYYHMVNVSMLSIAMAHAIGLHRDQIVTIGLGGLLHDIGKVHMPEDVLFHVGRLSEEQWRIVQKHPVDGAGVIFSTGEGLFHPAATVVLEHHSAYDLGGYPPLSGRMHPSLPARLVSVADCFDAVTSKRSYRAPAERREALEILEAGAGRGFDPRFVRAFVRLLGLFPIGSLVELSTGEVGLVVGNNEVALGRPTVMMVLDATGSPLSGAEERDLMVRGIDGDYRWSVRRSLDPAELGIDVMELMTTGDVESARNTLSEEPTGLVHEPSYGERQPDGYVDSHAEAPAHGHSHAIDGKVDPDIAPPFPA